MRTGFIYKLVCNDINVKECYVGSTDNATVRKSLHKSSCNNVNGKKYNLRVYRYIREHGGWDNWSLIEIEQFEYERKPQLRAQERHHMELLGATLNSLTPNRTIPQWRQDNAAQIKQQQNQKHSCECGGKYTHINKQKHLRTQRHCLYQLGKNV